MSATFGRDAFGFYLLDVQAGSAGRLIIERDDRYIDLDRGDYFYEFKRWSSEERKAIGFAGR